MALEVRTRFPNAISLPRQNFLPISCRSLSRVVNQMEIVQVRAENITYQSCWSISGPNPQETYPALMIREGNRCWVSFQPVVPGIGDVSEIQLSR